MPGCQSGRGPASQPDDNNNKKKKNDDNNDKKKNDSNSNNDNNNNNSAMNLNKNTSDDTSDGGLSVGTNSGLYLKSQCDTIHDVICYSSVK